MAPPTEVRVVIDALERLATGARAAVMEALNELAGLPFLRLSLPRGRIANYPRQPRPTCLLRLQPRR